MAILTKSLNATKFKGIFTEVLHDEKLGLSNPSHLRLFHLDVKSNAFSFDALGKFLVTNIGEYVYSRAEIDNFKTEGDAYIIGAKAIALLKKAAGIDASWINDELGNIVLYVLLEQFLDAPKLYNKIELSSASTSSPSGVHLRTIDEPTLSYQLVFGKSNVVGDFKAAIDNAFTSLKSVKDGMQSEMHLVETTLVSHFFDEATVEKLKSIILPTETPATPVDPAFGVFIGYSLGLDPEKYSNTDFRAELTRKMDLDIKEYISYIKQKIIDEGMSTYPFYIYVIPFNLNIEKDKADVMDFVLNAGVV